MKSIKFPEDEIAHDCIIEWWYINGHLTGDDGNRYAFMDCLFKAKVKEVEIPFLSKIPLKTMYFSHSIISDINNKKFYPVVDYLSIVSKDSFTKPLLFVNYTDPLIINGYVNSVMEETDMFNYHVKTGNMDLTMKSMKKPLLEGGTGFVNLGGKGSFYYSLTNLKTEGTIRLGDKIIRVKGKSWMDHQWADVSYSKDQWTWFSIQLDNEIEIVCYEYTNVKTSSKSYLASISRSNGVQEHTEKVTITPLTRKWKSPKTRNTYTLSWRIEVPSWNMWFEVEPMIENQEMVFGAIKYWEGPLNVHGQIGGKPVNGQGFMELLGRPSHFGNAALIKDTVTKIAKRLIPSEE